MPVCASHKIPDVAVIRQKALQKLSTGRQKYIFFI